MVAERPDFVHVYPEHEDAPEAARGSGKAVRAPLRDCAWCRLGQCEQRLDDNEPTVVIHGRRLM